MPLQAIFADTPLVEAANCEWDPNTWPGCGENWAVTIAIPPASQHPGFFDLGGPHVQGWWYQTGAVLEDHSCDAGSAHLEGVFEILSIDENGVKGRLCQLDSSLFLDPIVLNGIFSAPRCE